MLMKLRIRDLREDADLTQKEVTELLLCDCCDRIPAPQVLQHILGVSCVAGSLTATAFGAVPAMPTTSALHAGMLRLLER